MNTCVAEILKHSLIPNITKNLSVQFERVRDNRFSATFSLFFSFFERWFSWASATIWARRLWLAWSSTPRRSVTSAKFFFSNYNKKKRCRRFFERKWSIITRLENVMLVPTLSYCYYSARKKKRQFLAHKQHYYKSEKNAADRCWARTTSCRLWRAPRRRSCRLAIRSRLNRSPCLRNWTIVVARTQILVTQWWTTNTCKQRRRNAPKPLWNTASLLLKATWPSINSSTIGLQIANNEWIQWHTRLWANDKIQLTRNEQTLTSVLWEQRRDCSWPRRRCARASRSQLSRTHTYRDEWDAIL